MSDGKQTHPPTDRQESPDRRSGQRHSSDTDGACIHRTIGYNVQILDLSDTGARISMRRGLMPRVGEMVELRFLNGRIAEAGVVWVDNVEIGLRFANPIRDVEELLSFEELGAELFARIYRHQSVR